MNTIAKSVRTRIPLFSFTRRGLFGFLLVIGLVAFIYYLPNIVGIHVRGANSLIPEAVRSVTESVAPLAGILDQINEMSDRKPFLPSIREEANQTVLRDGLNWDVARSEPVRVAVNRARSEVSELLEVVPAEKSFARFALASYQLGLEQFLASRDDRFSAKDALAYLRYLDREVSKQMLADDAQRELLVRWQEVTLGDALKTGEDRVFRNGIVKPFDPQFELNYVYIRLPDPDSQRAVQTFTSIEMLKLEGSLSFRGTRSIKLYQNGRFVKDIPVPRPPKHSSDRRAFFTTTTESISGVYSFRTESDDGEVFIKEYSFYPRVLRIQGKNPHNDYGLGQSRERTPRLDRAFLRGIVRPNLEGEGMVPF